MKTSVNLKKLALNVMLPAAVMALMTTPARTAVDCQCDVPANKDVLSQVSLLQGLTFGDYNGSVKIGRLKTLGDTGIGTFDRLNGELIMLDGVVYRAGYDGAIEVVADDETVPFANVTFLDADDTFELTALTDSGALKEALNRKVKAAGNNRFYMVRIDGTFSKIGVRSEYAQKKPYKPLAKVLETDQTFFEHENVKGTVVGLYCPDYMGDLNAVGWHFHFISDDREKGGHILDLNFKSAEAELDITPQFDMKLSDNETFQGMELAKNVDDAIKKVETNEE